MQEAAHPLAEGGGVAPGDEVACRGFVDETCPTDALHDEARLGVGDEGILAALEDDGWHVDRCEAGGYYGALDSQQFNGALDARVEQGPPVGPVLFGHVTVPRRGHVRRAVVMGIHGGAAHLVEYAVEDERGDLLRDVADGVECADAACAHAEERDGLVEERLQQIGQRLALHGKIARREEPLRAGRLAVAQQVGADDAMLVGKTSR